MLPPFGGDASSELERGGNGFERGLHLCPSLSDVKLSDGALSSDLRISAKDFREITVTIILKSKFRI